MHDQSNTPEDFFLRILNECCIGNTLASIIFLENDIIVPKPKVNNIYPSQR